MNKLVKYIIVQAGGLGTRMEHTTTNKPKCLVPLNGKPIIQHILENYPDNKFIVIGDYKVDVLQKYVDSFYSDYDVRIVSTSDKGTCSGLRDCYDLIPKDTPFAVIWSDLITNEVMVHDPEDEIVIYTTNSVVCRYVEREGQIVKETSSDRGIVGFFTFRNREILLEIPKNGSLVSGWLSKVEKQKRFNNISSVSEIGTLSLLHMKTNPIVGRSFNRFQRVEEKLIKTCIDSRYNHLIKDEINWYQYCSKFELKELPNLHSIDPFTISWIEGEHCQNLDSTIEEKTIILEKICMLLNRLHSFETLNVSTEDVEEVYLNKTLQRIESVKKVIPFFENEIIIINQKEYKNPFYYKNLEFFIQKIKDVNVQAFTVIHGDPTFSNILVDKEANVFLFDPRGSFGNSKIHGDPDYDWAKLYYSLVGNYDSINKNKYRLLLDNNTVSYSIDSNGWEELENHFFALSGIDKEKIFLLNSIIWFSLAGYVIEDYDSIVLSFIRGIEYWNKIL